MADKNVQIRDLTGNNLYPKTKAALVYNADGANLGSVEAGAQVNKVENITLNGSSTGVNYTAATKTMDLTLPAEVAYTIKKLDEATSGSAATYQLAADGVAFGQKIEIPKDMVVSSGTVETVTTADTPYAGAKVGDVYIDLVLANATDSHVYIPANSLIDDYTAGDAYLTIADREISLNLTELNKVYQTVLSADQLVAANSGITATKVGQYDTHVANADIHVTAEQKATWNAKQDAIADIATIRTNAAAGKAAKDALDAGTYQTTLSATNKLDTAFIDTGDTAQFVTATEKATWSGKQDAIADLATIRSGAAAGATALQAADVKQAYTADDANPISSKAIAGLITYVELTD